jgi:hypothetical protein
MAELSKICENCREVFILPAEHKKYLKRRFCGALCSRRWTANNRSESWRKKNSDAKLGDKNPMFGIALNNRNSLANLKHDYWIGKTMSEESNIKRSKKLSGIKRSQESIDKTIQTKIDKGIIWKLDDPEYLEFKKYKRQVYSWTSKNNLTILEDFDKRGLTGYHLDHKYSIAEGFKNKVSPEIIGSIYNLRFIDHKENCSKGTKCSITLEKLYELFTSASGSLRKSKKCWFIR